MLLKFVTDKTNFYFNTLRKNSNLILKINGLIINTVMMIKESGVYISSHKKQSPEKTGL
jgi:hypothetical protein